MKTRSFVLLFAVAFFALCPIYADQDWSCQDVSGVLMTDIGAITPGSINLGPAFGDLGGQLRCDLFTQSDSRNGFEIWR